MGSWWPQDSHTSLSQATLRTFYRVQRLALPLHGQRQGHLGGARAGSKAVTTIPQIPSLVTSAQVCACAGSYGRVWPSLFADSGIIIDTRAPLSATGLGVRFLLSCRA